MSLDWATTITTLGGVAAALIGVVAGSLLTSRSERTHWARDKQIAACSAIVAESTRIQLALRRAWKHGDPVDWVPWNVALGTIWLVGSPAVVDAAARVDEVFWDCSDQFIRQVAPDEQSWGQARDRMETARLHFINIARLHIDPQRSRLTQVPVSRPPQPRLADPEPEGARAPDAA
ncbi:hypothetical protein [Streptomyces xylophagus]|uniref:hypothetical protein n=1 Tax=Streptomyces xylophagus TaxID=285514 RepID=UPI00069206BE|nr:hypothetical protein [Streptomyces xylophagus]